MSTADERTALAARQGVGARYDAPQAPAGDLLLARRGTAYFSRVLNGLPDGDLVLLPNAAAVAEVGYHARWMAEALAGLRTGMVVTPTHQAKDAASLPARALRGLFQHSAIHLDVEWRDLPGEMWAFDVPQLSIVARDTPLLRAKRVWQASLQIGGRNSDIPHAFR